MLSRGETNAPVLAPHERLTGVYTIDPVHSTIAFSVRHAMITNVRGNFTAFEGLLKLDGRQPTRSEAYVSVQTGSLDTGSTERDAHVTGPDFLDSASFPLMSFRSTGVLDADDDQFRMAGYLRIKDIELPVHIDLELGGASRDPNGLNRVGFEGTAILRRSDWGLDWNTALAAGGVLLSDKVKLILDISAVRLEQTGAA
ncbi:polyisoprenoid-binding protein [Streptomyces albiflavescens]|uniref:Polyisoprenoid-binding protein n=1 Tax=Streptomyces albiflavescens TaxID=1623582 RepID=A0A918CY04_9ACTN|nr:YceI family protein [Streptomyces albiflavescens]GGN48071.1 polyisoprenoid-binding protein [Streptomyces albiflavescens]